MDCVCPNCDAEFDESISADAWAKTFIDADSVQQEQMMATLRLLCPHLIIGFESV